MGENRVRSTSHRWRRKRQGWQGRNRRLICFPLSGGSSFYFSFPYVGHLIRAAGRRPHLKAINGQYWSNTKMMTYNPSS